jgi:hypothetical protein
VLAGSERPRASHADCDTERVTREDFDVGLGTAVSNIAQNKADESDGSLHSPNRHDAVQHELLWALLEMHKDRANS